MTYAIAYFVNTKNFLIFTIKLHTMSKKVNLTVVETQQTPTTEREQGFECDKITFARNLSNLNTEVQYATLNHAGMDRWEVRENLDVIIAESIASGYTENGLLKLPITEINGSTVDEDMILNEEFFNYTTPIVSGGQAVGTTIEYQPLEHRRPWIIKTSEVLTPNVPDYS